MHDSRAAACSCCDDQIDVRERCRRGEPLGAHGSQQAGGVAALRRDAHRRSAPATAASGLAIRSSDRPRDLHRPALGSLDRCGRSAAQRGRHATPHDVLAANRSTSKAWRAGPTSFRPRAERGEESAGLPGSAGSVADWGGARATSSPARGAPRCDGPCCLALFAALLSSAGRMGPCAFSNQFCRWRFSTGLVRQGQKRAERARFECKFVAPSVKTRSALLPFPACRSLVGLRSSPLLI